MFHRLIYVFGPLIAAYISMAVTPAFSEVKFNIKGVYGDKAGCIMASGKQTGSDGGRFISSKGYSGYEWQCKFVWAHREAGENIGAYHGSTVWSVITLCAGEGEAYSSLLSIQLDGKTATIKNSKYDPVVLKICK